VRGGGQAKKVPELSGLYSAHYENGKRDAIYVHMECEYDTDEPIALHFCRINGQSAGKPVWCKTYKQAYNVNKTTITKKTSRTSEPAEEIADISNIEFNGTDFMRSFTIKLKSGQEVKLKEVQGQEIEDEDSDAECDRASLVPPPLPPASPELGEAKRNERVWSDDSKAGLLSPMSPQSPEQQQQQQQQHLLKNARSSAREREMEMEEVNTKRDDDNTCNEQIHTQHQSDLKSQPKPSTCHKEIKSNRKHLPSLSKLRRNKAAVAPLPATAAGNAAIDSSNNNASGSTLDREAWQLKTMAEANLA